MGVIELASGNSVWRGMDYYKNKKVRSWKKTGEETYDGIVSGSNGNSYSVHIDKLLQESQIVIVLLLLADE